jgi:outer membrane protein OmpA-like peptidoglycan-associated protein
MEFVGGRHKILESSLPQLKDLLSALKNNPALKISIEGHVCCLTNDSDGLDFDTNKQNLSYARAKAIFEYLTYSGISAKRMSYKGFGHSKPIFQYPEKSEEEKTTNRRVEIRILDK